MATTAFACSGGRHSFMWQPGGWAEQGATTRFTLQCSTEQLYKGHAAMQRARCYYIWHAAIEQHWLLTPAASTSGSESAPRCGHQSRQRTCGTSVMTETTRPTCVKQVVSSRRISLTTCALT